LISDLEYIKEYVCGILTQPNGRGICKGRCHKEEYYETRNQKTVLQRLLIPTQCLNCAQHKCSTTAPEIERAEIYRFSVFGGLGPIASVCS
jgi:hypothetical protein